MHIDPSQYSIDNYKGTLHIFMFLIVLLKIHFIDKKLSTLEKRILHK